MSYQVTVTSQGQITIPAKIRKRLGIDNKRLIVREEGNTIILEPSPDILTHYGVLHDKAIKEKSIDEVIELEKQIITDTVTDKYKAK